MPVTLPMPAQCPGFCLEGGYFRLPLRDFWRIARAIFHAGFPSLINCATGGLTCFALCRGSFCVAGWERGDTTVAREPFDEPNETLLMLPPAAPSSPRADARIELWG